MKRRLYYLLPLLSMLFVACGGEDDANEQPDTPSVKSAELSFTTTVQTRALPNLLTELKDGSQMSIFVSYSTNSSSVSMQKAVCSNNLWKATPSIMLEDGVNVSFQAVYPYSDKNTSPSSVQVDVSTQTDYLYSGGTASVSKSNPTASIIMKHALGVFAFNIDKKGYSGAGKLQEIKLSGNGFYTIGNLNVSTGSIMGSTSGEFSKTFDETLVEGGFTNNLPAMFVIPSTSNGNNIQITIKVDGKEYSSYLPQQSVSGGNKYLFRMALTERDLVVFPDLTEVISLNADSDQMPTQELSTLQLKHNNKRMSVPIINYPNGVAGKIYWGDEQSQDYKTNVIHTYAYEGEYTVTIESWGANDVTMDNLSGVTEIDLSKF